MVGSQTKKIAAVSISTKSKGLDPNKLVSSKQKFSVSQGMNFKAQKLDKKEIESSSGSLRDQTGSNG